MKEESTRKMLNGTPKQGGIHRLLYALTPMLGGIHTKVTDDGTPVKGGTHTKLKVKLLRHRKVDQ